MKNTGLEAISTGRNVKVSADTVHGRVDDQCIDQWELKAARRALVNLKDLLYGAPMLNLLGKQIDQADADLKGYLAASNGEFSETQVILTAEGLTVSDFIPTLRAALAAFDNSPQDLRNAAVGFVFPVHPEHYGLPPYRGVVETMGGIPTRSRVMVTQEAPGFITKFVDESYPMRMTGAGELDDGTLFTYVLQQFKDTDTGMEANLRIWYPSACPPAYLEEHAEHYTVEFRNGFRVAAAALKQQAAD
jgi:hypothetical protein